MPIIFISYRRSDSQDVTGRIYDRLVGKFTPKQVFKDVDNIPLGVSFAMHIQQMIGKANVALVIIGPSWLTATDEQGRRRLDDPGDFVRVEVESALRAGMPVVPVLVANAAMPKVSELPKSMQKLVARNGIAVRPDPDFNNDIARLFSGIGHLDKLLKTQAGKTSESKKDAAPDAVAPIPPVVPAVIPMATIAPVEETRQPPAAKPSKDWVMMASGAVLLLGAIGLCAGVLFPLTRQPEKTGEEDPPNPIVQQKKDDAQVPLDLEKDFALGLKKDFTYFNFGSTESASVKVKDFTLKKVKRTDPPPDAVSRYEMTFLFRFENTNFNKAYLNQLKAAFDTEATSPAQGAYWFYDENNIVLLKVDGKPKSVEGEITCRKDEAFRVKIEFTSFEWKVEKAKKLQLHPGDKE
jgi:hypothetical protein